MTQQHPAMQTFQLPEAGYPMLTRMISSPLFIEPLPSKEVVEHRAAQLLASLAAQPQRQAELVSAALHEAMQSRVSEEAVTWTVGQDHPLIPKVKIVRMFLDRGGVEVYSVAEDGKTAMRNLVPLTSVRLVEEFMPLEVFVEELTAAEEDEDDDDSDPGEVPDPSGQPPQPSIVAVSPPNGQPPS